MKQRPNAVARTWLLVLGVQAIAVGLYLYVERDRELLAREHVVEPAAAFERLSPRPAAALELLAVDGAVHTLQALRGRPVLLHFWATWCAPCKAELPGLLRLGQELEREGRAHFVALSMDHDWAAVRTFLGGDVPASVFRAGSERAASAFDVAVLPDTYLVHADGTLGARFGGARDWESATMRAALQAAIAETAKPAPAPVAAPH